MRRALWTMPMEKEADRFASEALIPGSTWRAAHLTTGSTPAGIRAFAADLRISPAIVAGRIRHEAGHHHVLWQMVGRGEVRRVLNP